MENQIPQANTQTPSMLPKEEDARVNRDIAALSYVWVLSVFIFFIRKDSEFARFHAKQAMILFALSVVVWFIPYLGKLLELIILAGAALGFLAAAHGEWKDVPLVGPFSRGEATLRDTWKQLLALLLQGWRNVRSMIKEKKKFSSQPLAQSQKPTTLGVDNHA